MIEKLNPYPFQEEIILSLKDKYIGRSKSHRAYLHMATGSGKTLTAVEFIRRYYLSKNKRVLWIVHSWPLLNQAYETFLQQCGKNTSDRWDYGYWGAKEDKSSHELKQKINSFRERNWTGKSPKVLFTSFGSMKNNLANLGSKEARVLAKFKPDLVVIDEAHHGKYGTNESIAYEKLFQNKWIGVPILGLSATPKLRTKANWSKELISSVSFKQLVDAKYLAKPIVTNKNLQSNTSVSFDSTGKINNYSAIASDSLRNREIAEYYLSNRSKLKKTIIFAININHANLLGKSLKGANVNYVVIHGDVTKPYKLLANFKNGAHDVAILVKMGIEGIDIPDLNTVMLARPVTSEIEFAQMVGRGARLTRTKKSYNIIDFCDSVTNATHRNHLYHFKKYYDGASSQSSNTVSILPRKPRERVYQSGESSTLLNLLESNLSEGAHSLAGLRINPLQSFGIELELTSTAVNINNEAEWESVAIPLLDLIRSYYPDTCAGSPVYDYEEVHEVDYSLWNVVFDGSCGFEIVSPIMLGEKQFEQLYVFLAGLNSSPILSELKLIVDYSTGFHLHLGWKFGNVGKARKLLHFMREYEPAINSFVSPSRVVGIDGETSEYCASIRERFSCSDINMLNTVEDLDKIFGNHSEKYLSVNLSHFHSTGNRIEIRLHNGTLSPKKITLWIALWMNITHALDSYQADSIVDSVGVQNIGLPTSGSQGDIVELALSVLHLDQNPRMIEMIHQRRCELISNKHWTNVLGETAQRLIEDWQTLYSLYESTKNTAQ
ncbi:MAG: DEAD/DEAH box helicase family protein [Bacteriovoracaceae bacterium]|nr:DEAD/DEAH box helicase family protein [Bacteriovoracaceae bacterium]